MIRNLKGSYVLIGTSAPRAVFLSVGTDKLFSDRIGVAGMDKAIAYTFGNDVTSALPCTTECMEFVALNFVGLHADAVKAMCARIALGLPIGGDSDAANDSDGGEKVTQKPTKPRKPRGGVAVPVDAVAVQS